MKKLILTIGLPRSGKSTWSKAQGHPIVNPDSVRLAFHGQAFITEAERLIWTQTYYMVKALFIAGHETIILDATNMTKHRRDEWISSDWVRVFKIFDTSKEECIKRAEEGKRQDLIPIIRRMDKSFQRPTIDECRSKAEKDLFEY